MATIKTLQLIGKGCGKQKHPEHQTASFFQGCLPNSEDGKSLKRLHFFFSSFHATEKKKKNPTVKAWKCLSHKNPQVKRKTWERCVKVLCENHLTQHKTTAHTLILRGYFYHSRSSEPITCNSQDVYELLFPVTIFFQMFLM